MTTYQPFQPRPIHFQGVLTVGPWRLKRYTIAYGTPAADFPAFDAGVALALSMLPAEPAPEAGRPGVGFLIVHAGRGADYIVLGWWDRENELPVRVVLRDHAPGAAWRPAAASESFCVWDLQVMAAERDAYVATVLDGGALAAGVARYLAAGGVPAVPALPTADAARSTAGA